MTPKYIYRYTSDIQCWVEHYNGSNVDSGYQYILLSHSMKCSYTNVMINSQTIPQSGELLSNSKNILISLAQNSLRTSCSSDISNSIYYQFKLKGMCKARLKSKIGNISVFGMQHGKSRSSNTRLLLEKVNQRDWQSEDIYVYYCINNIWVIKQ